MTQARTRLIGLAAFFALLSGCGGGLITTVGPDYQTPASPAASRWQAPTPDLVLAHGGDPAALKQWWEGFNDPVLSRFLETAQRESANVAEAHARIVEARAGLTGAEAAGLPALDGSMDATRSSFSFGGPAYLRNQYQVGLQSNWEVDLFGGIARQRQAAQSQVERRTAAWHDARVAVAVEVADAYLAYRLCEALVDLTEADAISRRESARLTEIAKLAGLRSPADAALAHASAADGQDSLLRQQSQCERSIKGLVALTGLGESEVRHRLTATPERAARMPTPPPFGLKGLPAQVLMQRPDVAAAERDVAEASAKIGVEEAKFYPRLSLSGNITPSLQDLNSSTLALVETWSFGPTLRLPIFDAGKRSADLAAAQARYEAAVSRFRSTVRTAAKEVEESLVRLRNSEERLPQARAAAQGYRVNFQATEQLYRAGFGNLIDTEASRRQSLASDRAVAELEQEHAAAWIALYRAAGGAWEDANANPAESAAPAPSTQTSKPPRSGES